LKARPLLSLTAAALFPLFPSHYADSKRPYSPLFSRLSIHFFSSPLPLFPTGFINPRSLDFGLPTAEVSCTHTFKRFMRPQCYHASRTTPQNPVSIFFLREPLTHLSRTLTLDQCHFLILSPPPRRIQPCSSPDLDVRVGATRSILVAVLSFLDIFLRSLSFSLSVLSFPSTGDFPSEMLEQSPPPASGIPCLTKLQLLPRFCYL